MIRANDIKIQEYLWVYGEFNPILRSMWSCLTKINKKQIKECHTTAEGFILVGENIKETFEDISIEILFCTCLPQALKSSNRQIRLCELKCFHITRETSSRVESL